RIASTLQCSWPQIISHCLPAAPKEDETSGMKIEKSTEQRINLYYDLYVPESDSVKPRPLLIALHGYEGNKESMMGLAQKINSDDFIIASVQGPNSFLVRSETEPMKPKIGFGWMMQYKADETISLHHRTLMS